MPERTVVAAVVDAERVQHGARVMALRPGLEASAGRRRARRRRRRCRSGPAVPRILLEDERLELLEAEADPRGDGLRRVACKEEAAGLRDRPHEQQQLEGGQVLHLRARDRSGAA